MEPKKIDKFRHFMYVPWTGLGLYNGFRGNRWLRNRIEIFKQFVIPSLVNQTSKNFVLWCSWRPEEKNNPYVKEFMYWLQINLESDHHLGTIFPIVHTFHGVCFYDDKYPDDVAKDRLLNNLHGSIGELYDAIGECENVLMTIQPSDDLYTYNFVEGVQRSFEQLPHIGAFGFAKGYIMDYQNTKIKEWNPTTNPPFYTIKFPRETFVSPLAHCNYTAIKKDIGKYKTGTPIPSHEYVGHALPYGIIRERGFLVGTHGENISTVFNHPFASEVLPKEVTDEVLKQFGILLSGPLKIKYSLRKRVLRMLPFKIQRKLRYWFGERLYQRFYEFLRS